MTRRAVVAVATAVLAVSCAPSEGAGPDDGATATSPPAISSSCGEVERPPLQEGGHLLGDTEPPVPYSSVPPSSGWHTSGAPKRGVPDEPLTAPELVHALEAGDVVAAYVPDLLDASAIDTLVDLAGGIHADRLTVTAYADQPTALSLVAWGVLQRCDALDEAALSRFVLEHANRTADH